MSKKLTISLLLLVITIALYLLNEKISTPNNLPSISVKCPADDYDWTTINTESALELTIDCTLYDDQKISLTIKKEAETFHGIYSVYIIQDDNKLFLGETSLQTPGGVRQFRIDTIPSKNLIHVYNFVGDMGGSTKSGWFINTISKKFVKYSSSNSGISNIDINNNTYTIEYSLENGNINDYKSYFGKDMIINGLLLNNKSVITFDTPLTVKYDASNEIRPYDILSLNIESFSPSLDMLTMIVNEKEKFDIKL